MPLWIVILFLGAAGTGFVFLKAREADRSNKLKAIKTGHKSIKRAAKAVAKRPSTIEEPEPLTSTEEINLSRDLTSTVARQLEEVLNKKEL